MRHFVGDLREDFVRHIEYGLSLKGENALCLGADFFGGFIVPPEFHSNLYESLFQLPTEWDTLSNFIHHVVV